MAHALVVGAGIAGEALAVALARDGWRVTVVELAPEIRTGGQTVDLRGDSRQVLVDLGLIDEVPAHLVPQRGIAWIRADGSRMAEMPVEAFGGRGLISSEELLRSDLARVLHGAAGAAGVEYRFADTVEQLTDTTEGVEVRFRSGPVEVFDVVVGADGSHSRTRSLRFGPESAYRKPLGLAHAWFTLQEGPGIPLLDGWALSYNEPGRRGLTARPGHPGQQEIGMTFAASTVPRAHTTRASPCSTTPSTAPGGVPRSSSPPHAPPLTSHSTPTTRSTSTEGGPTGGSCSWATPPGARAR